MDDGVAELARVLGAPTRLRMLDELMTPEDLSVTELARRARVARPTASEAVATLAAAGLVRTRRAGRTTRVRLAGPDVADLLEALSRIRPPQPPRGLREHARTDALRRARTCYDHLAGDLGVRLADALQQGGVVRRDLDGQWQMARGGRDVLARLGIPDGALQVPGRRALVRGCPDWTERRDHLAGRLGAAVCAHWLAAGLVRPLPGSRALLVDEGADTWLTALAGGE